MSKRWHLASIFLFIFATLTQAQQVVALPAQSILLAPSKPIPGGTRLPNLSEFASAVPKTGPLAMWGAVEVRPHILYSISYSDGLLRVGQLDSLSSTIQALSLGSLFEIGKHWSLDYTLTRTTYSNRFITDSSDHNLRLSGNTSIGDWTFGLSQSYQTNSPTLIETAQQTKQELYSTGLNVSYRAGARTLVEVGISRSVRLANAESNNPFWTATDWYSWSNSNWIHYEATRKLHTGVGVAFGWDRVVNGTDMRTTKPQIQATWRPTDKISASTEVGLEYRKIEAAGVNTIENPVYSASVQYRPFEATTISLSASRTVSASYFANQASRTIGTTLGLSQRLLGKLFLTGNLTHGETRYLATVNSILATRIDKSDVYYFSLRTPFWGRGSISVFYQLGKNFSNEYGFGFSNKQIGTEISYNF